jgi:hypothetical protein
MTDLAQGELRRVKARAPDNGTEVLWGEVRDTAVRILSVPVFLYGVSRDSAVEVSPDGPDLILVRVINPSPGATIRVYGNGLVKASDLYLQRILPDAQKAGVPIGPATFLDPDIVAFHLNARKDVIAMSRVLDSVATTHVFKFWELGDPPRDVGGASNDDDSDEAWQLVHPIPVAGNCSVTVN